MRYFVVKTNKGFMKSSLPKYTDDVNQAKRYSLTTLKNAWTGPGSQLRPAGIELLEVVTTVIPAKDVLNEVRKHLKI